MALRFTIEKLDNSIRFKVKGVEVEMSYHAASALCNDIMETCMSRKEFATTKYKHWRVQALNGRKVKVRPCNQVEYDAFLEQLGISVSTLRESMLGKTNNVNDGTRKAKRVPRTSIEREEAKRQKILELQQRHHITPKK